MKIQQNSNCFIEYPSKPTKKDLLDNISCHLAPTLFDELQDYIFTLEQNLKRSNEIVSENIVKLQTEKTNWKHLERWLKSEMLPNRPNTIHFYDNVLDKMKEIRGE